MVLPAATGFTIPYIVSKGNIKLIGNIIEEKMGMTNQISDFPVGSLISIIILCNRNGSPFILLAVLMLRTLL